MNCRTASKCCAPGVFRQLAQRHLEGLGRKVGLPTLLTICLLGYWSGMTPAVLAEGPQDPTAVSWDYSTAYRMAEEKRGLLVVAFVKPGQEGSAKTFVQSLMGDSRLRGWLAAAVVVTGSPVQIRGEAIVLSDHAAFAPLKGQPGLAVINFGVDPNNDEYGRVIWALQVKDEEWDGYVELMRVSLVELAVAAGIGQDVKRATVNLPERIPNNTQENDGVVAAAYLAPEQSSIWMTDYKKAVEKARNEKKMLLVYVRPQQPDQQVLQFERKTLLDPLVMKELFKFVCVRVSEDYVIEENETKIKILDHPSLVEMANRPGLFIVDYASTDAEYYGQVVSVFPFLNGRPYDVDQMGVILTLPPGTLTQRTMIYAVRVHPERPKSILGRPEPFLFKEAEKHSAYQARIRLLGHHFWETRFHRILQVLRNESTASEVCAQSWPGQRLLEAALECVRCWRLSPGHWRAVSSYQDAYGYDIKKGSDGIWYATGVFANH
ncbi:MAG TPA: hypothetical protein PLD05_08740 [Thermogutta sp.]|mgnify:FL=1|nr:hypothetical protein [Thermogutta sp.]